MRLRIAAVVALVLMSMPGQVAAAGPTAVHLTGTLHMVESETLSGAQSAEGYVLSTATGLVGLQVTGDARHKVGAQVDVTGTQLDDGEVAVTASAIVVVVAAGPAVSPAVTPAAAATRRIAVFLGYYTDQVANPLTPLEAADAFNTNAASVKKYFETVSRNRVTTSATVFGPYSLGISSCQGGTGGIWANSINAMISAAAANGISLDGFDNVVLWTKPPCRPSGSPWIGQAELPGRYVQILVDYAEYPSDEPALATMVATHEIEHNLNLYHSQGLGCFDAAGNQVPLTGSNDCLYKGYGDEYTTMGAAGASDHALLDVERLRSLGWLDASESKTVTSAGTYTLVPTYSGLSGVKELRIVAPNPVDTGYDGAWTIELRSTLAGSAFDQFSGYSLPGATGITIRYSENDDAGFGYSYLLDTVADGHRSADYTCLTCVYWDAPLQPGHSVTDATIGISITLNSVGPSGASVTIGDAAPPSAPPTFTATALPAGGASLTWGAASDNVGIAGYRVYRDGSQIGTTWPSVRTYTDPPKLGVSGLHTYSVRTVDTSNNLSAAVTADVTLRTGPGAPTGVVATAGNGAALVGWTAPSTGGVAISYYTAWATTGGMHTCTTSVATSCVISGLTNGTSYQFEVKAVNGVGASPPSGPSNAVVPVAVPGRPTSVTGVAGAGKVTLNWVAPADLGSGTSIHYTAKASPGGQTCTTTTTSCIVSGLTNGTIYTFTVSASSSLGNGLPSVASAAIKPQTWASKPTGATAIAGNGSAVVSWAAPADNGGAPIISYTVFSWPDGKRCVTAALSCTVTGLTNRTSYQFSVTAANAVGVGPSSDRTSAVVPMVGATFVPVTPNRLVDSRAGAGQTGLTAALTSLVPVEFQATGRSTDSTKNIPSVAVAITGNLTAISTGYGGYLSITPAEPVGIPGTSTVNLPVGDSRANAVTAPLGSGGVLWVTFVGSGTINITFDVTGYFVANASQATYVPVAPTRLVDSRAGSAQKGLTAPLSSGVPARITVAGGVVPGGAVAVIGNLTAISTGGSGYFTLTPVAPVGTPSTSTLSFPANDTRANAAIAPLGAGGVIWVTFTGSGAATDVVFDVTGYFIKNTSGATYIPVTPNRIVDSRAGALQTGLTAALTSLIPAEFQVTGRSADATRNIPSSSIAVNGNLTAVSTGSGGYLSLTPTAPSATPTTSTVNFTPNDVRANAVTAPLGPGGTLWVTFVGNGGTCQVVFDVSGYYSMG